MLSTDNYKIKPWGAKYKDYNVNLIKLKVDNTWRDTVKSKKNKEHLTEINKYLSKCLTKTDGKARIYPYPDLIFKAFNTTPLDAVKVVILGQDPYHDSMCKNGKTIPQAMGLSFSVPIGFPIPSSLNNIYENLLKYKHIVFKPKHGNLVGWAYQGCMMLNTSLTVAHNCPNSHSDRWEEFTDDIIQHLSTTCEHIVFVLWGGNALKKLQLIDKSKHKTIISSHPSGLSYNKKLQTYPAFCEFDHFGAINKYLENHGKVPIMWQV